MSGKARDENMNGFKRSRSELPGLIQFRGICIAIAIIAAAISILFAVIRFPQSLRSLAIHGSLFAGLVAAYFLIIGLRTHIICSQCFRGRTQSFDRPAPEWITVLFLLVATASLFWPL